LLGSSREQTAMKRIGPLADEIVRALRLECEATGS
jgi:hypothetical protein